MEFDAPINRRAVEIYVEQVLMPALKSGSIVIIDNPSSHKAPSVKSMIEATGSTILYLPSYSSDFNLIEKALAKLKAPLPKAGS